MAKMQQEVIFSGFGGQGVMFVGQLLAYAAMDEGKEVTWIPSYGPEMRGGTAHCTVVLSDKPIGSPVVSRYKAGVVFNTPSFQKYEQAIVPDGLLAVNSSMVSLQAERTDITQLPVPASNIADEIGHLRLANVVMLGALLTVWPVLPLQAVARALNEHIPERHRDMLGANHQALEKGAEYAAVLAQV
jgi:2-oxoglutarate ferredoxin oxidoreductase subunit gamma